MGFPCIPQFADRCRGLGGVPTHFLADSPHHPGVGGDLCHSEHYGLWAISQGPGRSEDRLTVLGMGVASQAGGGPAALPAGPKALSLRLEAEPNLGGFLEAGGKPPPLCGQPSSSSASAEDPEAGGAWGTALEKDHAVVSRPAPRPTAPAFP